MLSKSFVYLLAACASNAAALSMDTSSTSSVDGGLDLIAKGIIDYYNGDQPGNTIGMFEEPYYWWESGAAWGSLLDYWYFTGDTKYNEQLYSSLQWQAGDNFDYMPANQTKTEGNDDQGYWGITLMAAAERGFKDPDSGTPSWSNRVQNIVDSMISRWDTTSCDGGLRWQIYPWNKGYDYKNSVSNGCLFHLSARLSRFNGDDKYVEWAEKTWDWMEARNFIVTNITGWKVLDGASISNGCTEISPEQWTYNAGLMLAGSAYLYDHTGDSKWLDRANHIWEGSLVFFKNQQTMYEASCQVSNHCNTDQRSFKAYFSRFLGLTSMLLPTLSDPIMAHMESTVPGVLSSCSGGSDGHTCGLDWSKGSWDGVYGLGEQMSALELLQNALLVKSKPGPAKQSNEAALEGSANSGISSGSSPSSTSGSSSASSSSASLSASFESSASATSFQISSTSSSSPATESSFEPSTSSESQQSPTPEPNYSGSETYQVTSEASSATVTNTVSFSQENPAIPVESHSQGADPQSDAGAAYTTVTVYTNYKGSIVGTNTYSPQPPDTTITVFTNTEGSVVATYTGGPIPAETSIVSETNRLDPGSSANSVSENPFISLSGSFSVPYPLATVNAVPTPDTTGFDAPQAYDHSSATASLPAQATDNSAGPVIPAQVSSVCNSVPPSQSTTLAFSHLSLYPQATSISVRSVETVSTIPNSSGAPCTVVRRFVDFY